MDTSSGKSWDQVRQSHPHQFVVFEAILSHSQHNKRIVEAINVVDAFADGEKAMKEYLKLHRKDHKKELYVVHTDKENLDITERRLLGIRMR